MKGVRAKELFVCGMYRSGSTLLFNLCKGLREYFEVDIAVKKVHCDWTHPRVKRKWVFVDSSLTEDCLGVYSYRDIRGVLFSFLRRDSMDFESFRFNGMPALDFLEWIVRNDVLVREHASTHDNVCVFQYESEVFGDEKLTSLVQKLSRFLKVPEITDPSFIDQFHFSRTKKFSEELVKMDGATQYWPNHLGDGRTRGFLDLLPKNRLEEIMDREILSEWLISNGYS